MPPAITVSPHLVTPLHTYCTVPTSSSPRLSPSLAHVCPRRKNSNQNGLFSKFCYLTWLLTLWIGGEDGLEVADRRMTTAIKLVLAQAFVAGATTLVHQLMGDGLL